MAERITIEKAPGLWVVRAGGAVLGETQSALRLHEQGHGPVVYFPRSAIAMEFLEKTATRTTCPFKGEATYYAIHTRSSVIKDAAWSYEDPKPEVAEIRDHLAFYPEKATVEEI